MSDVRIEGTSPLTSRAIIARTGTAPGQPFRRRALDVALAAILDDLRKQGYYTATALLSGNPDLSAPEGVHLVLRVDAGPRVTLKWDAPKPPGDQENFVPMRRQRSADADLLEDADRTVESYWRRQGYKNVRVSHTSESQGDSLVITMHTALGPRYVIDAIRITGNTSMADQLVREALGLRSGEWLDESRVLAGMGQVRLLYLRRGFAEATVNALEPEVVAPAPGTSDVREILRVEVTEGPELRVGTVRLTGVDPVRESAVRAQMRTKAGAAFSREDQLRDKFEIDQLLP